MQMILRLMTLMTMMLGGHVLTGCDSKVSQAPSAVSGGASDLSPGAPTAVVGTAGDSQVELTWSAPANNIETSITVYVVQYSSDNGTNWTTFSDGTSTLTSATVTGLTNGTAYVFRVAAKNANGTGVYSASSPSVTPVTNPGVPKSVVGTAGNAEVSLTWDAPESNGGTTITDYVIQYSSNNGSTWTTFQRPASMAVSGKITGLSNGTTYVFKVAAKNSVGVGTYSEISSSLTPATFPGAPTAVIATAGNAQVSLTWTAPASDGGAFITDYEVQHKATSAGEGAWTTLQRVASDQPSAIVTGLMNGTSYVFRVAAKNAAGKGSYLESSSSVTPVTTPDAPTLVDGTTGNAQVALTWNAPSNNGGDLITGYEVQYKAASAGDGSWVKVQSAVASANITELENGTAYVFRVAAKNSVGIGGFTDSITKTPARAPDAPTGVTGIGGDAQVGLSWIAPENTGGSSITEYSIQYSSDGSENWSPAVLTGSTSTSYTVTGLTIGTDYIFRVAARNSAGTGVYSESSPSVMPPLWTEVTLQAGSDITMRDNRTRLWWSKLHYGNSWSARSGCQDLSNNGQSDWRLPSQAELLTAVNNQIYSQSREGWIQHFNDYFLPEFSETQSYTNAVNLANGGLWAFHFGWGGSYVCVRWSGTIPETPVSLTATAGDSQVELNWTARGSGASAITDYLIDYSSDGGASWTTFNDGVSTSTSATVTGLTNLTAYVFRVAAKNSAGTGSYAQGSPKQRPGGWSAVTVNGGSDVTMRDNLTGLWWSNERGQMDWNDSHCKELVYNGQSDWRLPWLAELQEAVGNGIPSSGGWVWSNQWVSNLPYYNNNYNIWIVNLNGGGTDYRSVGTSYGIGVVCVRP